jgi:hypothetical protein
MKLWIATVIMLAACAARQSSPAPRAVAELAARRAQLIAYLHEYEERGVFPSENGQAASVFRDAQGVRCPMAELIFRSGHPELVDAVVRENNRVRLADVHAGPLHDWMLGSGLTRDEIAMVQGAMELDVRLEIPQEQIIYTTQAQIRGRLETAERVLRDNTGHGLEVAAAALPNQRVPAVAKLRGRVLPDAALASGPKPAPEIVILGVTPRPGT